MKQVEIYQALRELAEKLGIHVVEKNLQVPGIAVRSGWCRVHEQDLFIMDKKAPLNAKIAALAARLARLPTEEIYVVPGVREVLRRHTGG